MVREHNELVSITVMVIQKEFELSNDAFIAEVALLPKLQPYRSMDEHLDPLEKVGLSTTGVAYFTEVFPISETITTEQRLASLFVGFTALGDRELAEQARDRILSTIQDKPDIERKLVHDRLHSTLLKTYRLEKSAGHIILANQLRQASKELGKCTHRVVERAPVLSVVADSVAA